MRFLLILSFLSVLTFSQAQEVSLSIDFKGLASNKGKVLVKIVNEQNKEVAQKIIDISDKKATFKVKLPKGNYAISCFHDKDNNRKLNTNTFGIPNEKYGFSNDARGMFGPPDLKGQLIDLNQNKTISITLK